MIVVEGERLLSWNSLYAGMHHQKRSRLAREIHWKVRAAIDPDTEPFDVPVDIHIVAHYRRSPPDADNVAAKFLIDGLRGHVIVDDDRRWVRRVTTEAVLDKVDRVTITVTPVEAEE